MTAQLIILDEIGSRLTNVKLVNGYVFDIENTAIQRARLTPFKTGDLPAINYWLQDSDTLVSKTGARETRELPVAVEVYSTTQDEPFSDVAMKLSENIVTSLFRNTTAPLVSDPMSYALGGLVESVVIDSITPIIVEGEGSWCGVLVNLLVTYNIITGDFSTIVKY